MVCLIYCKFKVKLNNYYHFLSYICKWFTITGDKTPKIQQKRKPKINGKCILRVSISQTNLHSSKYLYDSKKKKKNFSFQACKQLWFWYCDTLQNRIFFVLLYSKTLNSPKKTLVWAILILLFNRRSQIYFWRGIAKLYKYCINIYQLSNSENSVSVKPLKFSHKRVTKILAQKNYQTFILSCLTRCHQICHLKRILAVHVNGTEIHQASTYGEEYVTVQKAIRQLSNVTQIIRVLMALFQGIVQTDPLYTRSKALLLPKLFNVKKTVYNYMIENSLIYGTLNTGVVHVLKSWKYTKSFHQGPDGCV